MRRGIILLGLLLWASVPARAELNIGFSVSVFPQLVMVPGYPVYYAPDLEANYFFYDGAYWVYREDNWYSSSWYNGPWELMDPEVVPLYILRIPVRYYRRPPTYFRGWQGDAPPRWGEHWGGNWSQHHNGWDRWDQHSAPAPAPLPTYQRQYSGARYPPASQQRELQSRNYNRQAPAGRDAGSGKSREAPQRGAPNVAAPTNPRQSSLPSASPRDIQRGPAPHGPDAAKSMPQQR